MLVWNGISTKIQFSSPPSACLGVGHFSTCLLLGTLAAAVLGLLNAISFELAYALAGLALAGVLFGSPRWIYRQLLRAPEPEEPRDSLGALGAAAALVFDWGHNAARVSWATPILTPVNPLRNGYAVNADFVFRARVAVGHEKFGTQFKLRVLFHILQVLL